jgi:hypothetical protein
MSDKMNNTNNNVKEDFLDEDPEIPSQKFVLLSFISPENVLAKKENFFFEKFLEDYEFQIRTKSFETYIASFVQKINKDITDKADSIESAGNTEAADNLRKNRVEIDGLINSFHEYVRKNQRDINQTAIVDSYNDFLSRKQKDLEDKFFEKNDFRTTMRGLKIRGAYATTAEAEARAKKLQRSDPIHNILIGEVGKWLPWDPNPSQIDKHEYANDTLNNLMKKYKENEEARDQFYKEQKKSRPSKQIIGGDNEPVSSSNQDSTGINAIFSEDGDLAIQRKMEAAAEGFKSS